jgi:peptidoglycan lytic transglycosylase
MVFRLNAAICGAVMTFAFSSVAMAQNEVDAVRSNAVVITASRAAIIGAASTYNPYRPGWREGGVNTASGERYDSSAWTAAIKTNLRKEFGGSDMARVRSMPSLRVQASRPSSKSMMSGL